MFGTIAEAVAALVLLGLSRKSVCSLLSVLSLYLCLMLYLMLTSVYYGYAFFISCIVTLIICLMAVHEPQDAFHLSVYRVEETLLGIGVYTVVTLVFSPRTSIKSPVSRRAGSHGGAQGPFRHERGGLSGRADEPHVYAVCRHEGNPR